MFAKAQSPMEEHMVCALLCLPPNCIIRPIHWWCTTSITVFSITMNEVKDNRDLMNENMKWHEGGMEKWSVLVVWNWENGRTTQKIPTLSIAIVPLAIPRFELVTPVRKTSDLTSVTPGRSTDTFNSLKYVAYASTYLSTFKYRRTWQCLGELKNYTYWKFSFQKKAFCGLGLEVKEKIISWTGT